MIVDLVVIFFFGSLCLQADELPKLPPETMGLIDGARGVAPEFSADLLLRLVGSHAITDVRWKRRLIDEAFTVAAHAQLPYRKHGDITTDTRYARMYWNNDLESLSLQTAAVFAMLPLDREHAREMFDQIPTPDVPALTCKETGAPELRAYYETAKDVFALGFTPEQRKKSLDLDFLNRVIGNLQSPAHVWPAFDMVTMVSVTPEQRLDLYSRLAGMLDHINGTPRVFFSNSSLGFKDTPPPVLALSLRAFILRHVNGPHCSDGRGSPVTSFNSLSKALDRGAVRDLTITKDELKPGKDEGTFERHMWWTSQRSKQVLDALKWLNHGNRNLPDDKRFFTVEERMSQEWNAHFIATLKLIEGWSPDEEDSPDDWFGMVSEAYELLADKAPRDEQRDGAIKRYLNFMETHYADVESHNLWFTQLKGMWRSKDKWITDRFAESRNPVIALYTKIARLGE